MGAPSVLIQEHGSDLNPESDQLMWSSAWTISSDRPGLNVRLSLRMPWVGRVVSDECVIVLTPVGASRLMLGGLQGNQGVPDYSHVCEAAVRSLHDFSAIP